MSSPTGRKSNKSKSVELPERGVGVVNDADNQVESPVPAEGNILFDPLIGGVIPNPIGAVKVIGEAVITAVASAVIPHENVKVLPSQPDDTFEIEIGSIYEDDDIYEEEQVVDGVGRAKPIFSNKAVEVRVLELQTDDRGRFELQRILRPGTPMRRPVSEMRKLIQESLTRMMRGNEAVTKQYWSSPFRALEMCLWKFGLEELNERDQAWFGEHGCNGLLPIQLASMFRPLRKDKEIIDELRLKTKTFYLKTNPNMGLREACEYCQWEVAEDVLQTLKSEADKSNMEGDTATDLAGSPDAPLLSSSPAVGGRVAVVTFPLPALASMPSAYQDLAKKIAEPSKEGKTALHFALKFRASAELVLSLLRLSSKEALLQRGTSDGYTPLHEACSARASKKIIHMVLKACPEALQIADETRPIGLLPVHIFLRRMQSVELSKDVLNLLLSESRGGRLKPESKQLLLLSHCKNGAWEDAMGYTARSDFVAQVDHIDSLGRCAIHYAAYHGAPIALLKKLKAASNKTLLQSEKYGFIPIQLAACNEMASFDTVSVLVTNDDSVGGVPLMIDDGVHWSLYKSKENSGKMTALHLACANPHVSCTVVRSLLPPSLLGDGKLPPACAEVVKNKNGWTAFHFAAWAGRADVCRLLLEEYCDTLDGSAFSIDKGPDNERWPDGSVVDMSGWTALHLASYKGHASVCHLILHRCYQAALYTAKDDETTPFHVAATVDVINLLLVASSSKELPISKEGLRRSPLHYAAIRGNLLICTALIEAKVGDASAEDKYHKSAAYYAAQLGHVSCVTELLKASNQALVKSKKSGKTSAKQTNTEILGIAAKYGQLNVFRELWGKLTASRQNEFLAKIGTEKVHQIDAVDNVEKPVMPSLFQQAVLGGNREICEILLENAKEVKLLETTIESTGRTPLHIAASCGHEDLVDLFLEKGANFQAEDKKSERPLHDAARGGFHEICRKLVQRGADVDDNSSASVTALHYACAYGHIRAARVLIEEREDDVDLDIHCTSTFPFGANGAARTDGKDDKIVHPASASDAGGEGGGEERVRAAGGGVDDNKSNVLPQSKAYAGRTLLHLLASVRINSNRKRMTPSPGSQEDLTDDCALRYDENPLHLMRLIHQASFSSANFTVSAFENADGAGDTALHYAAKNGNGTFFKCWSTIVEDSLTAQKKKDQEEHTEQLIHLMKYWDRITNLKNMNNETALDIAIDGGHADAVDALLAHGADPLSFRPPSSASGKLELEKRGPRDQEDAGSSEAIEYAIAKAYSTAHRAVDTETKVTILKRYDSVIVSLIRDHRARLKRLSVFPTPNVVFDLLPKAVAEGHPHGLPKAVRSILEWSSNVDFIKANPLRTASESDEHKKITKEEHFIDEYVAVKGVLLGALNSGQDEVTAVLINRFLSCHKGEEPSTPSESPKMLGQSLEDLLFFAIRGSCPQTVAIILSFHDKIRRKDKDGDKDGISTETIVDRELPESAQGAKGGKSDKESLTYYGYAEIRCASQESGFGYEAAWAVLLTLGAHRGKGGKSKGNGLPSTSTDSTTNTTASAKSREESENFKGRFADPFTEYLREFSILKKQAEDDNSIELFKKIRACGRELLHEIEPLLKSDDEVRLNKKDATALHLACCYGLYDVCELLLQKETYRKKINAKSRGCYTPLHCAAFASIEDIGGDFAGICELLLRNGADVTAKTTRNETPLHLAAMAGHRRVLRELIKNSNNKVDLIAKDKMNRTPFQVIAKGDYITKSEMLEIFWDLMCNSNNGQNDRYFEHALELTKEAMLASPSRVLVWRRINDEVLRFLQRRFLVEDVRALRFLAEVIQIIRWAADDCQPSERHDLKYYREVYETLMRQIFSLKSMESEENIIAIMLMNTTHKQYLYRDKDDMKYGYFRAAFSEKMFLGICIEKEIKFAFGFPQISYLVDEVFVSRKKPLKYLDVSYAPELWWARDFTVVREISDPFLSKVYNTLWSLQTCPAAMFFLEGLSKVTTLTLVSYVSTVSYGRSDAGYVSVPYPKVDTSLLEVKGVIVMFVTTLLYELGQLIGEAEKLMRKMHEESSGENETARFKATEALALYTKYINDVFWSHFKGPWNFLDLMSLLCIAVWIFTFQYEDIYNETVARGAISLAAIPLSLSLLQFLCMVPSLGHFVIMIGAVLKDVMSFLFVFIACIIGFSIALRGIFYDNENFVSTGQTLLTVYSGIFGNLDFTIFDPNHPFDHLGQGLLVVYSMLTAIVLINLLIARMAYTYQKVSERVEEEWGFFKAETTQTFLEFEDRNPLCKLPAPLNVVSMFAALFGFPEFLYWYVNGDPNPNNNNSNSRAKKVLQSSNSVWGSEDRLWKILTKLVADAFFRYAFGIPRTILVIACEGRRVRRHMSYRFTSLCRRGNGCFPTNNNDHRVRDTPAAWLFTIFVWPFVVLALETTILPAYVTLWESIICLRLNYLASCLFSQQWSCFKGDVAESSTTLKYQYLSPNNLAKAREPHKRFSGRVAEGDEHLFDPSEIKAFFRIPLLGEYNPYDDEADAISAFQMEEIKKILRRANIGDKAT